VARRADPERIHQARRAAVRNSLTDYGMSLEDAERWCDAWEIEAQRLEVPRDSNDWTVGSAWIAEQRARRRKWCVDAPEIGDV
jgi:hypothetical protein